MSVFFENSGTCIFIIDDDLTILSVNSQAAEFIGLPKDQIEGKKKWETLFASNERHQVLRPNEILKYKSGQVISQREATLLDRDGKKRHMVINTNIISDEKKIVVSAIDITDRKNAEKSLKIVHDEMELRVKERTEQLKSANLFLEDQIRTRIKAEQNLQKSETKYRQIFNDLGAVIVINNDMTIAEINEQFEKRSGYSPKDILDGAKWVDFVHPDDLNYLHGMWNDWQLKQNKEKFYAEFECRAIVKSGEYENFIIRAAKIPYSDQLVLSFTNITVKTKVQAALVESERKLSTLMNNLPGMAYKSDTDSIKQFTFVSDGCKELTGYTANKLTNNNGNSYTSLIHADDLDKVIAQTMLAIEEKKSFQIGYRIITASKTEKWVLENAVGIYSDDNQLLGVEGFIIDANDRMNKLMRLTKENIRLRSTFKGRYRLGRILGKSDAMQNVYEMILKAAASDSNVIIYGQSGTGKELTAQAVHEASERKGKPFVTVNCGAIPENLFESEFFGYKKGAFTGAVQNKSGYYDKAHGGTLFMDEIGEIPLNMQVKLLRVIEGGGYLPVGSTNIKYPDTRIVFATNRNLAESIKNGLMREDFYYRIHIFPIDLPPLNKRQGDIPLLIDHFLKLHTKDKEPVTMSDTEVNVLKSYSWPGNVRELQNVVHRYVAMGSLDFMHSTIPLLSNNASAESDLEGHSDEFRDLRSILAEVEKKTIYERLVKNKWNKSRTASELQIDRKTLMTKIQQYNLIKSNND